MGPGEQWARFSGIGVWVFLARGLGAGGSVIRCFGVSVARWCGVKGSKTNQVNNQRNAQTYNHNHPGHGIQTNGWTEGQGRVGAGNRDEHWGRHPVKVNVTAHLIARTE